MPRLSKAFTRINRAPASLARLIGRSPPACKPPWEKQRKGGEMGSVALRSVHREPGEGDSSVDTVHHRLCLRSMDRERQIHHEPHSAGRTVDEAQWRPMATTWQRHSMPRVRVGPAQTGPTRARQSPFETQSELTVDQSTLTVDLAPQVSGTDTLGSYVR